MSAGTRRWSSRRSRAGAGILALTLLAAGCGTEGGGEVADEPGASASSSSPTAKADPSAHESSAAAAGQRMRARGMTFVVPKGWADVTEPTPGLVLAAADLSGSDELADMIIVESLDAAGAGSGLGALARTATRSLTAQMHEKVTRLEALEIAGVPAAHARAIKMSPGEQLAVDRFAVSVAGQVFTITYSTNRWKPRVDRAHTLDAILASWSWEQP